MKNYQTRSLDDDQKDRQLNAPSVTKYMTKKLITFKPDTPINDVIESLLSNRITGAPVLNKQGELVGMIDDKDCLNVLISGAYHNHPVDKDTVASYMTQEMKTITENNTIIDVSNIFLATKFKRLLVMGDDGKLAGQISRRDILRAIHDMNAHTW